MKQSNWDTYNLRKAEWHQLYAHCIWNDFKQQNIIDAELLCPCMHYCDDLNLFRIKAQKFGKTRNFRHCWRNIDGHILSRN